MVTHSLVSASFFFHLMLTNNKHVAVPFYFGVVSGKWKTLTTYLLLTCYSNRKESLLQYAFSFNFLEIEDIPERRRKNKHELKTMGTMLSNNELNEMMKWYSIIRQELDRSPRCVVSLSLNLVYQMKMGIMLCADSKSQSRNAWMFAYCRLI